MRLVIVAYSGFQSILNTASLRMDQKYLKFFSIKIKKPNPHIAFVADNRNIIKIRNNDVLGSMEAKQDNVTIQWVSISSYRAPMNTNSLSYFSSNGKHPIKIETNINIIAHGFSFPPVKKAFVKESLVIVSVPANQRAIKAACEREYAIPILYV